MSRTKVIETERLAIVPFGRQHLTREYVRWLNDPEVVRFSEQRLRKHTLASCRAYWKSFDGSPHYFWAIVAKVGTLGHIGNMNAYVDRRNKVADVGILIGNKRAWGKGYGLEAWRAVCRNLLTVQGMRKVTAGTLSVNKPMLAIMRHSGMEPDGVRARQVLLDGREVDIVHAALFRGRDKRMVTGGCGGQTT